MKVRKILFSLGSITALSATGAIAAITTSCNKQTSDSFIINVDKASDEYYICGKQSSVYKFSALSKSTGTAVKSVTYNPLFFAACY